jgi:hypothetical protein
VASVARASSRPDGSTPRARIEEARRSAMRTPGTSIGYCMARKRPAAARREVSRPRISVPSTVTDPPVAS